MKFGPKLVLTRALVPLIAILLILPAVRGDNPSDNDGTGIDIVEIELENRTGVLHFGFLVTGSAPPGTNHVNVTFGYQNSSMREELDIWIEPINMDLLDYRLKLIPSGSGDDNWTEWKFEIVLNIPMENDLSETLSLLLGLIGMVADTGIMEELEGIGGLDDIANLTGLDGIEELLDMETLFRLLSDTEILFIAHAVDGEGNITVVDKDIKFQAIDALFGFLIEEGLVEDPFDDDVDDDDADPNGEVKDEGDDSDREMTIAGLLLVSGGLLFLSAGLIIAIIFISRKRN